MTNITVDFQKKQNRKLKPVNGICNGPIVGAKNFSQDYRELGIPYVRLHDTGYGSKPYFVDISHVFPDFSADENDPASFMFHHTDLLLNAIDNVGAKIIYRLGESIDHTIYKRHARPPKDFKKWASICVQIIRHYNEGWADGFHLGIEYWEIWNEPDAGAGNKVSPMWAGGTQKQAFDLYRTAAEEIKKYNVDLKVGGMAFTSYNDYSRQFIDFCAEQELPLDFFSYHSYFSDLNGLVQQSKNLRGYLQQRGFNQTEIIFDEWNFFGDEDYEGNLWIGCRQDPEVAEKLYTRQKNHFGASFVAAAMMRMNESEIDIAAYYDGQCTMNWCGLYNRYGAKQKTYHAFRLYGLMYSDCLAVAESSTEEEGYCVISSVGSNASYILISNHREKSGWITLHMKGLGTGAKSAEVFLLDEEYDGQSYKKELYNGEEVLQSLYMKTNSVALIQIIR